MDIYTVWWKDPVQVPYIKSLAPGIRLLLRVLDTIDDTIATPNYTISLRSMPDINVKTIFAVTHSSFLTV